MSAQPGASADGVETVNDGIRSLSTVAATFTLTILYLGITAASTTHAQLLRGRDLRLPLLDVEVPVFQFFRIAPWMLVALHLVFLLQVLFVYRRLRGLGDLGGRRELVVPSIFSEAGLPAERASPLALLVRLVVLAILLVPLGLLALMQVKFLPYHAPAITRWFHQVPALVDLLLCAGLIPLILSRDGRWRGFWTPRPPAGCAYFALTRPAFVLGGLAFLGFSWGVAVVPGAGEEDGGRGIASALGVERNLDVSGQRLVDAESWRPAPGAAPRHATLTLSGRDLRGADFSHAVLPGVDFRGADLRAARFAGADLRGADFSPRRADDPGAPSRAADLTHADFAGAALAGARLDGARLAFADLAGADLSAAHLDDADLRGADLTSARMAGASLRHARLTGATLDGATLECADLYAVDAEGLRAVGVHAGRADLRRARLAGATWAGADLRAAELADVVAAGGDFRGADLRSSRGLSLIALDLRRAELAGATVSSFERAPRLADVRGATLAGGAEPAPPRRCERRAGERPAAEAPRDALPVADVLAGSAERSNLLDARRMDEASYYRQLTAALLGPAPGGAVEGCASRPLAASLALRALGCTPPRDPVVEKHLLPRVRELAADPANCPAFAALAAELAPALPPAASGAADAAWPESAWVPRWGDPALDCETWRDALWRRALAD